MLAGAVLAGADRALLQGELQRALAAASPPVSAAVTNQRQIESRRILYEDIKGDTELWRVVALLVLAGAAFAALNLTARVVEAQRREIGIGMALGVRARLLALRPLLFGGQVAVIGVLLGVAVGYGIGIPLRTAFTGMLPLPVWQTPFQAGTFAQAAAIGFVLPFAAVAWPVWRAVRVQPVQAIRVGHLAARGGGLAPLLRRLPLPGRGYHQIPLRNVLRTPRRSALTVLGIGAALATLVTITGFLDTFRGTLSTAQDELLRAAPSRVSVSLDSFYPADSPVIQAVRKLPQAGDVQAGLLAPATVRNGGRSIRVAAEVLPAAPSWTPSLVSGTLSGGIVLSSKAAADLHAVLTMTTVEAALIGTLGTLAGIAGGYGLLSWMVATTIPGVMPELGVTATLTGASILTALLLGLGTVTIAPLFTLRRLRRMDIPSTLRLVE